MSVFGFLKTLAGTETTPTRRALGGRGSPGLRWCPASGAARVDVHPVSTQLHAAGAAQRWAGGTADKQKNGRCRACAGGQAGGGGGAAQAPPASAGTRDYGRDCTEAVLGAFLRTFAPLAPARRPPHVRLQASRANPIGPHHFGSGARALPPPCPRALHAAGL